MSPPNIRRLGRWQRRSRPIAETLESRTLLDAQLPEWVAPGSYAQWNATTHTLSVFGPAKIVADPTGDDPVINAGPGARLTFAPATGLAVHVAGLHLSGGAEASIEPLGIGRTATNHRVLVVKGNSGALTVDDNSTLDVTDNGLMLDYADAEDDPAASVESLVSRGFNGGDWGGTGITSSVAVWNANFAVGVGDNLGLVIGFGDGDTGPTFAGQPVDSTCVLIKFTYRADLDLDGVITSNDAAFFNGYYTDGASNNRWTTGDLDYDGVFTSNDSSLFNNFYDESPKGYFAFSDPTTSLTGSAGCLMFGSALVGSNGYPYMEPELFAGSSSASANGRTEWDDNIFDGLDSGGVYLNFDANLAAGTTSLIAGNSGSIPASYSGSCGGTIGGVVIKAGSQINGSSSWSDLVISFYADGVLKESINVNSTLSADGSHSSTGIEERRLVVTPGSSNYDRVTVHATFRLQCGSDTFAAPADLFGEIDVLPAA